MSEVARRDTGVTQHRHPDGTRTWTGAELDLRRALDLARRNGRLATAGELERVVNVPGAYVVRVRLVEAPRPGPAARPVPGRAVPGSRRTRYALLAVAATAALGLLALGVAALLGALAALLPILGGVLVVAVIGFVIVRMFGGGGDGGASSGGFGGLYIHQSVTIRR